MKKIQENFCRTGNVCLALTSDVAAQRMIGRNLHENEVNAVRIGDPHFVQSPRFGAGLPGDRGNGAASAEPRSCPAISMNDWPAKNTVPPGYSRAIANPRVSR